MRNCRLFRKRSGAAGCSNQAGHAVAEFIAMSAVLVPMALLVPALGKIADMNHAAIESSRYVAWERTIASEADKDDATIAEEVRRRFFSNTDAFIFTNEGSQSGDDQRQQLWRDHRGNWMLRGYNDVTIQTADNDTPGSAAGMVADLMSGFMNAMGSFSGDDDTGISGRGLFRADVNVNVGSIPLAPFDTGINCAGDQTNATFLCIRRHNVILGDTWASGSSSQMERRVRALVPTSAFEQFSEVTDLIGSIPILSEFRDFRPGYVAPDTVLPPDRLQQ